MKEKLNKFSVSLGLFDYINPILYCITSITILRNINDITTTPWNTIYLVGALISILFGFAIPTVKTLVGLGKFEFKMPVNLVFYVNSGILISGLTLIRAILNIKTIIFIIMIIIILTLLTLIYLRTKKFNTIAVLTGAFGYILLYISLITLSIIGNNLLPIILYGIAIIFFLSLCLIGIRSNLKDPKIHWIIETSNVLCQLFVAIATILLF